MTSPRLLRLALFACLDLAARAATTTVVNETFADGARTIQASALPLTSLAWRMGPAGAAESVSASRWSVTPSTNTILVAHFHPVTLSPGDTLAVSFTYRHAAAPGSTSFRIGLLDSGGARLTSDVADTAPAVFAGYTGYVVFNGLGANAATGGYNVRKNLGGGANLFATAENGLLSGPTDKGPGPTAAGTLYTGSITLTYESLSRLRVDTSFNGVANTGADAAPVATFDTLALFITAASGRFDLGDVTATTTGAVNPPAPPAPRLLQIDRRGGAAYASIAQAVATGLNPGDTLRLAPGSGPYRETVYLPASGTAEAPIVLDGSGETITGFAPLSGFQTVNGVTTCDLPPYWTGGETPQGFTKVNGRWAAISAPAGSPQPMPFVLSYKGERLVQSSSVRTTPPAGSAPGTLGKLGQLTRHATLSDDGNTLTLLPGVSASDWEISTRVFVLRILNASHQTYRNIKATGALNDGVNLHGWGENLLFENIEAFHNLDEGFSAHDTISCEIRRDAFYRNDNGLVNVNDSVLVATDVVCHDNLGHGFAFMNAAIADLDHARSARNGSRGLAIYNQAAVTLARAEISGGGWTQKPLLSSIETGGLSAYVPLELATAAGARLLGETPAITPSTPPLVLALDCARANLEVLFLAPTDEPSQLQVSSDLVSWTAAGEIRDDGVLHRWTEPVAARRFYRVVRW